MKRLLIVESPAKIKTIKKFLGPDFKIMATMGHIKDLPTKEMGVTRDPITLSYVPIEKKEKTIAELAKAAGGVDEVYLAPDPDREGEIIAWHVYEEIKKLVKNPKNIFRIAFNEITKSAVIEAIEHPGAIDMKKVSAQQARRVLDRWVGYEVSPVLWRKVSKGLSAGRVQSVALKMICDREQAIRDFKPEEYWSITGLFKNEAGQLPAPLTNIGKEKAEIASKEAADKILKDLEKASYAITEINDKTRSKNPLAPFMTSTLQQAAYNRLGFSVKKTMQLAQNLYEGISLGDETPVALITYMRTDSLRIADSALKTVRGYISQKFGDKYLPSSANVYEKKSKANTQDAHEAVRPVDVSITPEQVKAFAEPAQAKLYELIWHRFVASQMTPAQFAQRQVVIKGADKYFFKATGSTLLFDGFLAVYNDEEDEKDEKDDKVKVPEGFKKDDAVNLKKIDPKQHFTQPPPRYSEASLVKEMEKEGIGRPSTYATVMNTICAREYTTLDKKRFVPTELGMLVTKLLTESFSHIMNIKFTALMEEDLDKIAEGELERDALLNTFWENFEKDLIAFKGTTGKASQPTDLTCPECKTRKLLIRFGKAGEFIGCEGFPDCSFTSNFTRDEAGVITLVEKEKPQNLDIACPECKKPLREMMGRFGKFISCSGYPDCKYIHQNKAGFKCPQDGGDVCERKWRGGTFWGCKNYPKCKYALFGDIQETPCPQCKAPALLKKTDPATGTVTLECADKKCGYKG